MSIPRCSQTRDADARMDARESLLQEIRQSGGVPSQYDRQRLHAERLHAERRHSAATCISRAVRKWLAVSLSKCMVCLSSFPWCEMVSTTEQRCHRACKECCIRYCDAMLEEGRLHVKCLGPGCANLMENVNQLASPAAVAKREANRRDANKRRLEEVSAEDNADEDTLAFRSFCATHARKCPLCAVLIYRDQGCNHVVCKCGAHFDWERTPGIKLAPPKLPLTPPLLPPPLVPPPLPPPPPPRPPPLAALHAVARPYRSPRPIAAPPPPPPPLPPPPPPPPQAPTLMVGPPPTPPRGGWQMTPRSRAEEQVQL